MPQLMTVEERRRKYKRKVSAVGKGAVGPAVFTPKYGSEPGPLTPQQEAFLAPGSPERLDSERRAIGPPKTAITPVKPATLKKVEDRIKPSKFSTAMEGVKRSAAETPVAIQRSPLFNRAKENIIRGLSETDYSGGKLVYSNQPYLKYIDGKLNPNYKKDALMPQGHFTEGGSYIVGPRTTLHEAKTPEERIQVMKNLGQLDVSGGRVGEELARRGEQKLSHIRGRYLENVARMRGGHGVEEAKILSEGRDRTKTPIAQFAHRPTEEGSTIYSKFTGQDVGAELPTNIKQRWEKMKAEEKERFYKDYPQYRSALKRLYE